MKLNDDCPFCDKALAMFGVLLGAVILFISVDILTGSGISNLIGKPRELETPDDAA